MPEAMDAILSSDSSISWSVTPVVFVEMATRHLIQFFVLIHSHITHDNVVLFTVSVK